MAKSMDIVLEININKMFRPGMSTEELYEVTRGIWRLDRSRAEGAELVLAVFGGLVREVYQPLSWHAAGSTQYRLRSFKPERLIGRSEFEGRVATDAIREQFIGKTVPRFFGNPVRYASWRDGSRIN